jgi:hypothetical protein
MGSAEVIKNHLDFLVFTSAEVRGKGTTVAVEIQRISERSLG